VALVPIQQSLLHSNQRSRSGAARPKGPVETLLSRALLASQPASYVRSQAPKGSVFEAFRTRFMVLVD